MQLLQGEATANVQNLQLAVGEQGQALVAWLDASGGLWAQRVLADGQSLAPQLLRTDVQGEVSDDTDWLAVGVGPQGTGAIAWIEQTTAGPRNLVAVVLQID